MSVAAVIFWAALAAMGYVFAGYPLLLLIIGSVVRRRPVPPATTVPTVSLIVSAYNEEKIIGEKLDKLSVVRLSARESSKSSWSQTRLLIARM